MTKTFSLKNAYISSRKAGELLPLIKGKSTQEALTNLDFSSKKASMYWKKLIKSGTSFYEDKGTKGPISVKEAYVGQALIRKKRRASARGRMPMIRKRYSHLYIKLEQNQEANGK